jgi:stress response protein SCP2
LLGYIYQLLVVIYYNKRYKDQGAIVATADSLGGVCNSDKERMEIQNEDVDGIDGNSKAIFINGGV